MVKKSMTEAEAIEVIRKAMEFSISAITELDKAKEKIDMVGLAGEYYENKENCEREIAACMLAINALKEIREYRAIGTVEEIKEILQIVSEGQEDVDESGISTGVLHTLLEYGQYKKIGTVEECRAYKGISEKEFSAACLDLKLVDEMREYKKIGTVEECRKSVEKQIPKKSITYKDTNRADCPVCGATVRGVKEPFGDWCSKCGQKLDWSET